MDFDAGIPMSRGGGGGGLPVVTEETSLSPSLSEGSHVSLSISLLSFMIIKILNFLVCLLSLVW